MNRSIHIGLSALSGITLGLLWAYANGDKTKQELLYDTAADKKEKKISVNQPEDNFTTAIQNRIKTPLKNSGKQPKKNIHPFRKKENKQLSVHQWNAALQKNYITTQLTISNSSKQEKAISLWGGNSGKSVSPPAADEVEDHTVVHSVSIPKGSGKAVHPQGMAVNPVNGFVYVANQLSNTVSVITTSGAVVTVIKLHPSQFPGYNSPVAVAVNTKTDSPHYGTVYVVGSVANTVSVINLSHQVINEIAVGVRPLAIAFNPVNENLYVSNVVDDTVSVIDTHTETLSTTLSVGEHPMGIGINPVNGDTFICNSGEQSVSVFNHENTPVTTIIKVGRKPTTILYHPVNNQMYLVATNSDRIIVIDSDHYTVASLIHVGRNPYQILFNSNNNFLYVGNRTDNTYSIIAPDNSIRKILPLTNVNIGLGIHQEENILFSSDTQTNTIHLIGYQDQSSSITINEDVAQKQEEFKHRPVQVKHMKVIVSKGNLYGVFRLQQKTISGSSISKTLSLSNYNSPQQFLNTYEIFDMDGAIIDGRNSWNFKMMGEQSMTLLIYYKKIQTIS